MKGMQGQRATNLAYSVAPDASTAKMAAMLDDKNRMSGLSTNSKPSTIYKNSVLSGSKLLPAHAKRSVASRLAVEQGPVI